nr:DUF6456 domain-containing protein [Litoreibacter ascidiaceicola]
MFSTATLPPDRLLPTWIPDAARRYLFHTEKGLSLRDLARREGCHASTILRQVRRFENRRDDPLVDEALHRLSRNFIHREPTDTLQGLPKMTAHARYHSETYSKANQASEPKGPALLDDEDALAREARRVLRRLCETGAVLALASDMDKAVVLRSFKDGPPTRTAVVSREVAQAFALKDWINCTRTGRVASYSITTAGRAALKQYLDEEITRKRRMKGAQDGASPFRDSQSDWDQRLGASTVTGVGRSSMAESPLAMLARRRDKDGRTFLAPDLVQAGERFREDYELAQMGQGAALRWDRFMVSGDRTELSGDATIAEAPKAARERILSALDELGPGLSDIIMRCCCFLEGLEAAEKRMGWSARSGKVVLRIALQRLHRHYMDANGHVSAMIG